VDRIEYSEGGVPIIRHRESGSAGPVAGGDPASIERITEHIENHIGTPATVWHEIISEHVHLDVHVVRPTLQRRYYTLVTSGMSARPMTVPPGCPHSRYAELAMALPPTWPMSQADFKNPANYWPIHWLKTLARMPHQYKTWLGEGHTVPNGDPAQPFAANTKLCCMLILKPKLFGDAFLTLEAGPSRTIHFLSPFPIYRAEMDLKLKSGVEAVEDGLDRAGVTELLNVDRPSVVAPKPFWQR
jgi:hypothetical protein